MNLFWQLICMVAFGGACWAIGDIILKGLLGKNVDLPPLVRPSLAFAAGNVAMSYLLTLIGFMGGFVPMVLRVVFWGGIGITVWRVISKCKRNVHSLPINQTIREQTRERKWVPYLLITIVGLFYVPAILQAAAPPYVRDSLVYHLLCPKEYLKAGNLVHVEGNIFSAFPKGHEVLMTLLLCVSGDRAAQGLSILQQFAAIGEIYGITYFIAGPLTAAVCVLGFATVPPILYFSGCGYVEPALLMSLGGSLLVLFLVFRSIENTRLDVNNTRLRYISLLGLLAGWMAALKYNGLIYLGLIGFVLLWNRRKVPAKKALIVVGVFSASAAPGLCWMVWNWLDLGNPVYPMAWFLFGGSGWDEIRALAMSQYFDFYGMGRSLRDYLMLPWNVAFAGRFDTIRFDGAMGPFLIFFLLLAIVSAILLIQRRLANPMLKNVGVMFVISAAFFVLGTQQVRFWLPSQMVICIFAAPALGLIGSFIRSKQVLKVPLVLIVIGAVAWNIFFLGKQFFRISYYKPVLTMEQERAFLLRQVPGYRCLEFMNRNLTEHSRVLCVWTGAYGYYIDRSYYSDTFIEDATFKRFIDTSKNGKELSQRLGEAGFTHLFVRLSVLVKNMNPNQQAIFVDLLRKGAVEVFNDQDYSVLGIKGT